VLYVEDGNVVTSAGSAAGLDMLLHARMSRRSFQRKFKESTGLAPLDWLVRERVALACDLLQERPGMAIELVAELAGFGSSESLRRHLRRLGQPSPTVQRQGPRPPVGSP
jgi:AraC family transcriptional activator FtrA